MKLYYVPHTRAYRPRWLLEELGVPYELVRLDVSKGENRRADYLAIHPHGSVPALVDGDVKLFESAAICLYLADKFPERQLAPRPDEPARGEYLQWMIYSVAEMDPPLGLYFHHSALLPEAQRVPAIVDYAKARWARVADAIARHLAGREYALGDRFTAVDVMWGSVLAWAGFMRLLDEWPVLLEYSKRVAARDAAKRARAD